MFLNTKHLCFFYYNVCIQVVEAVLAVLLGI